ncbi:hypothetical protein ACJ41O_010306 [Fusarium nematophilum]
MRSAPSILASCLLMAAANADLDTSPPCIKACYDDSPPLNLCEDIDEITDEILARCTCSSFTSEPPLYECIRECPKSEQATYVAGLEEHVFGCQEDFFPDITVAASTAPGPSSTSAPTSTASEEDDQPAATTTTNGAGEGLNRAAPTVLAAGVLVAALLL